MISLTVRTAPSYEIRIGGGLLRECEEAVRPFTGGRVMLVSDDTVFALYGRGVLDALGAAGLHCETFVFPHGEASKNIGTLTDLLCALAEKGMTRSDCLLALGGGVVGDLAGFAAAVYLRGVRYVQCPTTLLSAVDSSVGGKTAVDLPAGKNLAGAFWQPSLVLIDTETLQTLPPETYADGMAEVIKYGILGDAELFRALAAGTLPPEELIYRCVSMKARFVEEDERDTGIRRLLNLGHTAGHAIEAASAFRVPHGRAVAMGTVLAARYAARKGLCSADVPERIESVLRKYHLPTVCPYPAEVLTAAALRDKKRAGNTVSLILPREIGRCEVVEVAVDGMKEFLE